jgi:endonuclease-3
LMKLPWIGIKSAKVIGHVLRDLPVIAVDTHVHRVVNRWWITNPSQPSLSQGKAKAWSPGTKTPEETSEILEKIVPKKYKDFAHHAIVLFGRYVCTAKKPKCEDCKLKRYCDYYFNL